jgi:hypothetical protein
MNAAATIVILMIIATCFSIQIVSNSQLSQGVLYENGTCTNEKFTNSYKQQINTSGTVGDFLKSLPSDNTILAQIVCNDTSD